MYYEYGGTGRSVSEQPPTKTAIIQEISAYCMGATGVPVDKVEKLEEAPTAIRHACKKGGISMLQGMRYTKQVSTGNLSIPCYFCKCCGKLFVYTELM